MPGQDTVRSQLPAWLRCVTVGEAMGFLGASPVLAGCPAPDRANVRASIAADQRLYASWAGRAVRRGWDVCWPGCPRRAVGKRLPSCRMPSRLNRIVTIPVFSCLDGRAERALRSGENLFLLWRQPEPSWARQTRRCRAQDTPPLGRTPAHLRHGLPPGAVTVARST